jgi:ADP-ribose pyrophosphatase YjhB (NUDIX family)
MQPIVKATVAAIITRQGKGTVEILLTRRTVQPFQGLLCLPGGHIDRFETAAEAVIREVKEETGLDYTPRFFSYFDEMIPAQDWHAVVLVFTGTVTGVLSPAPAEVSEACWLSIAEALAQPLAFRHNDIITRYVNCPTVP